MQVGDRVEFTQKMQAFYLGWPYHQQGEVIENPYRGVWIVRLDRSPLSRVAVTENSGIRVL